MAFLGDLVVRMRANISPFQSAMKKAAEVTQALKSSMNDMKTTAAVFSKLAASIKATNNQMDRLVHVSKGALAATMGLATAENHQFKIRMQQLKMMAAAQRAGQPNEGGGSMIGAGIAGGIAGSLASGLSGAMSSGVGFVTDMGVGMVNLAADAETARIQFEVLTGSAEKGVALFKNIEKFAARTSFDLASASDAAKQMLAAGVGESDIMGTMQLLGDLAMGDANKLGFLSKAYTDVLNKGKLQGQELRQFAENGVGLASALSQTMGVTTAEILKMSEAGEISFRDMQEALLSLNGEGGRFHGMMARINETFKGQWNSLIENIQTVGRDLGALILPHLTSIVSEVNKVLQGFMNVNNKAQVFSDILNASADVAIEYMRENWAKLMDEMISMAFTAGQQIANNLNPVMVAGKFMGGAIGRSVGGAGNEPGKSPLQSALDRQAALITNLKGNAPAPQEVASLLETGGADGSKLKSLASGIMSGIVDSVSTGAINRVSLAAQSKFTDLKIKGGFLGSVVGNMFGVGGDKKKSSKETGPNKIETKFAGAMQKGSAEAFSTVLAAMMSSSRDPNVIATQKQTVAIVKAVKENKPPKFAMVEGFAGAFM